MRKSVDVCVATYKRPVQLAALLESLVRQKLDGLKMRIVVVDNDPEQSAGPVVRSFRKKRAIRVVYAIEPVQGISFARNRALELVKAPYFAFLDDDETAAPNWLAALMKTLEQYGADAVFGAIQSVFPDGVPAWAKTHYLFNDRLYATGMPVTVGPTSSVLVRTESLGKPPLRFDPAFALTGGSDSEFFFSLYLAGRRLVRCAESVVYDAVPAGRLTVDWICRRGYRFGQSYARVFASRYSLPRKVFWFLQCLGLLAAGALALPPVSLFSRAKSVELLTRLCYVTGKLSFLLGPGMYFKEYASPRAGAGFRMAE